ncbi:MAG: hypothetical protein ACP5T6_00455 [Candidatus Micrarchaeia archaeon]
MNDIQALLDSKFGGKQSTIKNIFNESIFNFAKNIIRSEEFHRSLVDENMLDKNVIKLMKFLQEHGSKLYVVTRNKGIDEKWLSSLLKKYEINIEPENIYKVNGNKGNVIKSLKADLIVDDQSDIILDVKKAYTDNEHPQIIIVKRTYNNITSWLLRIVDQKVSVLKSEELYKIYNN